MLWIGLHFPRLPLETLLRGSPSPEAWAVVEHDRILMPDSKAQARGVRAGMHLSGAVGVAPQLRICRRDSAAETENLLGLAAWTAQFTPAVAIDFPHGLLLEVSGSLKLFGSLDGILGRIRDGVAAMGFSVRQAVAPTAQAASWLARVSGHVPCRNTAGSAAIESLHAAIEPLPVTLLRVPEETLAGLAAIGVSTMGQLLSLPRDGVARRFGRNVLDELDRALGTRPDPRSFFTPPPGFHAAIELPAEVTQAEALFFAGSRLIVQLSGFLAARASGVQHLRFRLFHREGRSTTVDIGLVAPSRDEGHFKLLLRERLGQLRLPEAVRSMTLDAEKLVPHAGCNRSLVVDDAAAPGDWPKLIERLRARLGEKAVHGLDTVAEHRPERAYRSVEPGTKQLHLEFGERPFWLLEAPQPLQEVGSVPHYRRGPLALLAGPERIESGWWDGADVTRDYYMARTHDESLVWIYRDLRRPGWYLHGIFS